MRTSHLLIVGVSLVIVAGLVAWLARRPLSEAVVARWFASQQVDARYRITALSPSEVTLSNVALGPVARPDFTAERIVVGWSPLRSRIDSATLLRPVLRATLSERGVSFGSLDRLLPRSDTPQPLPDIDLRLVEARVVVGTPFGPLTARGAGAGRLRDGFSGVARVDPATLAAGGCGLTTGATLRFTTASTSVAVAARGAAPRVVCADGAADAVGWQVAATLPPTLDSYRATIAATAAKLRVAGYSAATARLYGDAAAPALDAPLAGRFDIGFGEVGGRVTVRQAAANGSYRIDTSRDAVTAAANISMTGAGASLPLDALRDAAKGARGTLVEPLAARLARGLADAARSFDAAARVDLVQDGARRSIGVRDLDVRSKSGARLLQTGRGELRADGALILTGGLALSGGGLPTARVSGSGTIVGNAASGVWTATLGRWTVPGASVEAPRLDVRADAAGVAVDGPLRLSGGLGGGVFATGLTLPLSARIGGGGFDFGLRCTTVQWASLTRGAARLAPGTARLCPAGGAMLSSRDGRLRGGATSGPLALRGSYAGMPLSMSSAPLRLLLTTGRATLAPARFDLRYGVRRGAAMLSGSLDLATLTGGGRIAAASFDDPAAPVNIERIDAAWRLADGNLGLSAGTARIIDRTAPARFEPLAVTGVTATLANGRIEARGSGTLASSGARLFGFSARHNLASARGSADLDTGTLLFGPALQPFQITENLRGIVENVRGPVIGKGRVDWTGTTLTSRGTLRIDKLGLATAALGPVEGIDGSLEFTDLLTLTTPPGQRLRIARINPGVAVDDGVASFRMLAPDAAAIEQVVWPYAGGTLTLAPVTIRAGDLRRDFRLVVDNLDAEAFLQRFEIKNLNVTGRFDGVLPLVFADGKGRIAGGKLVARTGGLVQYVGDVANSDLGAGARLAFDALRRLRYRELTLDLDGDLDGELVTQLRFAGTNEAATTLGGGPLPIRATGLPFKFNVTVRAPFRSLLGTAASFSDVRPLIRAEQVQPR